MIKLFFSQIQDQVQPVKAFVDPELKEIFSC